jgi:type VI secretion system protein ImpF
LLDDPWDLILESPSGANMAELTPRERLQPSLLDRLTDHEPAKREESRDQRVLSLARLRECVIRDITWLLNAERMSSRQQESECPDAMRSVINYGIPSLSGITAAGIDTGLLEREIIEAIHAYEPRLIRGSVTVRALSSDVEMGGRALTFNIEADLWAQPLPLHLYLQTELDLESGRFLATGRGD